MQKLTTIGTKRNKTGRTKAVNAAKYVKSLLIAADIPIKNIF